MDNLLPERETRNAMRTIVRTALLTSILATAASSLPAQIQITSRALTLDVGGRLHSQFNTTSDAGEPASEFLIRRARLEIGVTVSDFVSGAIQPDFGEGGLSLKDAYVQLSFSPQFEARVGQFKRPFDLFELTSSTQTLVIERDGEIRGVDTCAGTGSICSFSRFTEELEYADRDIGVQIQGQSKSGRFTYLAAITNGAGANRADENGAKSLTGRVEFAAQERLSIGVNLGLHDYVRGPDDEYAVALGGDVAYGDYDRGLHVQGGLVVGDNWQNLVAGDPATFATAQAIVSYKLPLRRGRRIQAVEPVGRLSWGDPNTDGADDAGLLFTPGFVIHFTGRNKIAANLDVWSPSVGDTEVSLKVQSYLHF